MIIKASQRGNARELARHLTNAQDNEQVEIHEINGFIDETVLGAFEEAQAVSQGTKCTQFLYSVSLNPPKNEKASIADFEEAIEAIEEKMNLQGQPRVVIFHEKHGRRHAHAIWSRIDIDTMKAINLPFYKNKMMEISKELYLKHGWELPQGFIDKEHRNPLNFTREQWQQAKRLNESPQAIKTALKECWSISDSKPAFQQALEQQGFTLAKGDRRGFVAVDWRGEIFSLSRWLGVKTKILKQRLGKPEDLPSVDETKAKIDKTLNQRIQGFILDIRKRYDIRLSPLQRQKTRLFEKHRSERKSLEEKQEKRHLQEHKQRHARLNKGIRGLWDRLTGKRGEVIKQNQAEAYRSYQRDRDEKDALIFKQLDVRQPLQAQIEKRHTEQQLELSEMKEALFSKLPEEKLAQLEHEFNQADITPSQNYDMEM
ncbi:MAG: relaxase [Alphaproteobacteria bacterium]|nr:MAG: relaxase [Alphaproteobacteria bacterium]